jgi:BirA family biotin operon repressor/biotin-[acetyl-CoA-carboxylase] ligase
MLIDIPLEQLSTLPFVSVLAAYNAIAPLLPKTTRCEIKWPNDLLINDQKVSGILLESHSNLHHQQSVIMGCGINVMHYPDNPAYPTTSLAREGVNILPEQLFLLLAKETANLLEVWDYGNGFNQIRQMWLNHAKGIGKRLQVKINDHEEYGIFHGIDETGCLLLDCSSKGVIKISAGDVFFPE